VNEVHRVKPGNKGDGMTTVWDMSTQRKEEYEGIN
jgi:hypothetical protein